MKKRKRKKRVVRALLLILPVLLIASVVILAVIGAGAELDEAVAAVGGDSSLKINSSESADWESELHGKATYVGVDDSDTAHSTAVLQQVRRWSNSYPPFYNGYGGLCELWVYDTYVTAGLPCNGTCCAYRHSQSAQKEGKIPKGALIFSGIIPSTGQMYENNHRASAYCDVCGHYAGHVAIYAGNGMVAGAQIPYLMDLDTWIEIYGYGGWSLR